MRVRERPARGQDADRLDRPALKSLSIDYSWVSAANVKALEKAFKGVQISAARQQALVDPEDYGRDRYVQAAE